MRPCAPETGTIWAHPHNRVPRAFDAVAPRRHTNWLDPLTLRRQREREHRPLPELARDPDLPTVELLPGYLPRPGAERTALIRAGVNRGAGFAEE
jgi:protein tyrosine/serine phosphatase